MKKHNVSETGFVSVLRWGKTPTLLGPSITGQPMSQYTKAINTWDQVKSMRANRKIYIKIVLSTHMRETRLDREVEIYTTKPN
jgi:hypothetical protein